jgi:hypothetical protein
MMFNATFNNISVLSWQSVLLVEETGIPGENNRSAVSHWQALSHNVVSSTHCMSALASIYEMIFDFGHYYDSVVLYCYKELCTRIYPVLGRRTSWLWSYGSWIYKYLCNQCLSPLTLWVQIPLMQCVLSTIY